NQIQLIKVVEILFVLHCGKLNLKPGNVRSYANNYRHLNREEMNDIRVFLCDFFAFRSLSEWHEFIDELLIYAYKEGDEGLFNDVDKPFKVMAYFEKLAEAIFLIYEIMKLKESYPKSQRPFTQLLTINFFNHGLQNFCTGKLQREHIESLRNQ